MSKKLQIAPSILSADFADLKGDIARIEKAGADLIHVDVMDGHFVPNITIGPCVVKSLKRVSRLPLNVHLMIEDPAKYIEAFSKAGSDRIVVHAESEGNLEEVIRKIKSLGREAGVSIKPGTGIDAIKDVLDEVDEVLVMTVEPGFGGQAFMRDMMPKIRKLRGIFSGDIAVDGGINADTAKEAVAAGANVLIAGTAIFGADDINGAVRELRAAEQQNK